MSKVTLPRLNQTGANEWSDVEANDVALREVVNGGLDNENIAPGANIARSKLEASAQGVSGTWYTPKVIATEETRENTAFGTLPTPDEIPGVIVPANGVLRVNYQALWKNSVKGAGRATLFIGSNQAREFPGTSVMEAHIGGVEGGLAFTFLATLGGTLSSGGGESEVGAFPTTGMTLGVIEFTVAAGTYSISMRFKASSGSITVKERKMAVAVLGT